MRSSEAFRQISSKICNETWPPTQVKGADKFVQDDLAHMRIKQRWEQKPLTTIGDLVWNMICLLPIVTTKSNIISYERIIPQRKFIFQISYTPKKQTQSLKIFGREESISRGFQES